MAETNSENVFGKMFEFQSQMFDFWKKSFFPGSSPEKAQNGDTKPAATKALEQYFNMFTDFYNQWWKSSGELFSLNPPGAGTAQQTWQKMLHSNEIYFNIFRFWQDLVAKLADGQTSQTSDFVRRWQDQYTKMLMTNFVPGFLPESLQSFFKEPRQIFQMYANTAGKLFNPWEDTFGEMQAMLLKSLSGNKDAYLDFIKSWQKNYENTFAKLLRAPNIGMTRELADKLTENMDKFMDYLNVLSEFSATIYRVGTESMETLLKKYQEMMEQDSQPKTFREFYELWWKTSEDAYQQLFGTEDFAKLLSQVVDAGVVFKKNQDLLMEEFLKQMPVPLKSEMNDLYKTLYDLKKEVRNLKRRITSLEESGGE